MQFLQNNNFCFIKHKFLTKIGIFRRDIHTCKNIVTVSKHFRRCPLGRSGGYMFKICIRMIEKFYVCAFVIGLSIGESTREFRFRATKRHENSLVLLLFLMVHFTVLDEISVQGSIL